MAVFTTLRRPWSFRRKSAEEQYQIALEGKDVIERAYRIATTSYPPLYVTYPTLTSFHAASKQSNTESHMRDVIDKLKADALDGIKRCVSLRDHLRDVENEREKAIAESGPWEWIGGLWIWDEVAQEEVSETWRERMSKNSRE